MKTRVRKWSNSLALRIPKSITAEAGLRENAPIELSLVDGNLVVQPDRKPPPTLADFLAGIAERNPPSANGIPVRWSAGKTCEAKKRIHPRPSRCRLKYHPPTGAA